MTCVFLKVNPPKKQDPNSNQNKDHVGSRYTYYRPNDHLRAFEANFHAMKKRHGNWVYKYTYGI